MWIREGYFILQTLLFLMGSQEGACSHNKRLESGWPTVSNSSAGHAREVKLFTALKHFAETILRESSG